MAEEDRSGERSQSSGMHGDTVKLALKSKRAVVGLLSGALIADIAAAAPFGTAGTLGPAGATVRACDGLQAVSSSSLSGRSLLRHHDGASSGPGYAT